MMEASKLKKGLGQFYCTEQYHKQPFSLPYTDGVKYLADSADSHWLIQDISLAHIHLQQFKERKMGITFWKLKKHEDDSATLSCGDDEVDGKFVTFDEPGVPEPYSVRPVYTEDIPWTTFPLDEISIWMENGILILPSEH